MELAYPSPHTVRRNFTLQPFNEPFKQFTEPLKIGNASFSASVIEALLETPPGDYKSFQTVLEAFEVRIY
jgi:tyrosinase